MAERQPRAILIDPFFDGARNTQPRYTVGDQQQNFDIVNEDGHGAAYAAPSQHMLGHMRPGPRGMTPTVIPRATQGGIPIGTRPHDMTDLEINIDPHIPGQSSTVRLGELNPGVVARGARTAAGVTAEPVNVETQRLRAAATMHMISQQVGVSRAANPAAIPPVDTVYTQTPMSSPQQLPAVPPQQRLVRSPLSAFNQPQMQPQHREMRQLIMDDTPPPPPDAGLPEIQAIIEMEGYGPMTVYYHDVVIEQGFMVLVFNTRCHGAMKFFPPTTTPGNQPPKMAIQLAGHPDIYGVETTGIIFEYDKQAMCVLAVTKVVVAPQE